MAVTDVALLSVRGERHSRGGGDNQTGLLFMGWEIDVGEVHCGGFKFRGGKRIRQTVLFAEDQRELLGERECVYKSLNPGCVSLPVLLVGGRVCTRAYLCLCRATQKAAIS